MAQITDHFLANQIAGGLHNGIDRVFLLACTEFETDRYVFFLLSRSLRSQIFLCRFFSKVRNEYIGDFQEYIDTSYFYAGTLAIIVCVFLSVPKYPSVDCL